MPLPIDVPGKIIAIGLNYHDHAREVGAELPRVPMVFGHWPNALIGPGDAIILPDPSLDEQIDYEAELAVVIGERVRNVSAEEALEAVAGYCAFNDVSARTLQRTAGGGQHTLGKSLDTFDPVGVMTPARDLRNPQKLRVRTILNGKTMQDGNTSDMIFPVADLIAYISRTVTLEPGDLIATGTPAGVGMSRKPPVALKDGDEITIDIEGLEPLTNPICAEKS